MQVLGNRMYEKKLKDNINTQIAATVEEKRNEVEFLEAMIKELEEQLRIEIRKKAILKNQCDQAYLKQMSAMSMEAMKMSTSTLQDYYQSLTMPSYDGQNIYSQIRRMNDSQAAKP